MRHDYAFVSRWEVAATPERCWAELSRVLRSGGVTWWPAVRIIAAPPDPQPGGEIVLGVRSPLGYTLRVTLTLTEVVPARAIAVVSAGDLDGRGRLQLDEAPGGAVLTWTWEVTTRRRWMRVAGPALRPAFVAAHRAVMRRGERGFATQIASAR